jgi:hypothetical protein
LRRAAGAGLDGESADRAIIMPPRCASSSDTVREIEYQILHMNSLVAAFPDRELHVILDNLNTHKKNERWLKRHPNVHFHFTPTRASWLNQIEIWFSILQGQSLSGASFTAIEQLQEHIDAFIAAYNETAEPFAWTKKSLPAAIQKSAYHSTLIPGTSVTQVRHDLLGVAVRHPDLAGTPFIVIPTH